MKTLKIIIAALCMTLAAGCTPKTQNEQTTQNAQQTEGENAVIENIMARRSIRKYKQTPVSRDTLDLIMKCGINAPNGQNRQSWEVRIVDDPTIMAEFKEAIAQGHPDMPANSVKGCFRDAPVMVFIARDLSYDFSAYDCGLLAENIMLSAWSLGVGSICLGSPVRFLTDNDACRPVLEKLGFSEGYELSLCVGFGYPDETPAAKPRDWGKVKYVD
jgi:nitroreductase